MATDPTEANPCDTAADVDRVTGVVALASFPYLLSEGVSSTEGFATVFPRKRRLDMTSDVEVVENSQKQQRQKDQIRVALDLSVATVPILGSIFF